jgi:pimeloyl-ACP methyl ester carboxylesterase
MDDNTDQAIVESKWTHSLESGSRFVDVMGQSIRYVQEGAGRDLLMIHGSPGSIEDWMPSIKILSRKFKVTAFDLPGHGFSSAAKFRHNIENYVVCVKALMKELRLSDPILLGHSYGGAISLALAGQADSSVRSFLLVAPAVYPAERQSPIFTLISIPFLGSLVWTIVSPFVGKKFVRRFVASGFLPFSGAAVEEIRLSREIIWLQRKAVNALRGVIRSAQEDKRRTAESTDTIQGNIMIVNGSDDIAVPSSSSERLSASLSDAPLVLVAKAGHYPQYTHPQVISDAVGRLLAREGD